MKFSIRTQKDGSKIAVDETGNTIPWIHAVQTDLDRSGRQVMFLATFDFSAEYTLGADTPNVPPEPPKAP